MSDTYMLTVEYDGADFAGWQIQPRLRTVQGELTRALSTLLREPARLAGAGRTDAGVHAEGQVASFRTGVELDTRRLRRGLNALTGRDIVVRDVARVAGAFHARASARARSYRYRMLRAPSALHRRVAWYPRADLDASRMAEAARHILGTHDFRAFAAAGDGAPSKTCTVVRADLGPWSEGLVFEIEADRFLHHMVRILVGTLVEVGRGRRSPDEMGALIAGLDRRAAGPTVPAHGLTLVRVDYPPGLLVPGSAPESVRGPRDRVAAPGELC